MKLLNQAAETPLYPACPILTITCSVEGGVPADTRAKRAPLESLPPETIPDTALWAATALTARRHGQIARAGLTDVFRSRDHWLEPWEKVAIISLHHQFPLEGYRRRVGPGGWWR